MNAKNAERTSANRSKWEPASIARIAGHISGQQRMPQNPIFRKLGGEPKKENEGKTSLKNFRREPTMSEPQDEIIRDGTGGIVQIDEEEHPCENCPKTAVARINYYSPGKRRKQVELFYCHAHFERFYFAEHPFAYSITKLK
jgi:hypothetical protein